MGAPKVSASESFIRLQDSQMEMMQVLLNVQLEILRLVERGDKFERFFNEMQSRNDRFEKMLNEINAQKSSFMGHSSDTETDVTPDIIEIFAEDQPLKKNECDKNFFQKHLEHMEKNKRNHNKKHYRKDSKQDQKRNPFKVDENDMKKKSLLNNANTTPVDAAAKRTPKSKKLREEAKCSTHYVNEDGARDSKQGLDAIFPWLNKDKERSSGKLQKIENFTKREEIVVKRLSSFSIDSDEISSLRQCDIDSESPSLQKKNFSFGNFVLLSPNVCNPFSPGFSRIRKGSLSPYALRSGILLDKYPKTVESSIEEKMLFPLCFPDGAKIRIIPRCALSGAKRLGWFGRKADSYQLHSFQDMRGNKSLGISITTRNAISLPNIDDIKDEQDKHLVGANIISKFKEYRRNIFSDLFRHGQEKSLYKEKTRKKSNKKKPKQKLKISEKARELACESYQTMIKNFSAGYVCIVEKCYIMIGIDRENLSLLFSALKGFITQNEAEDIRCEDSQILDAKKRHDLLGDIQSKILLTPKEILTSYPKSDLEHLTMKREKREIELMKPLPSIKYSLPLPQLTNEWGLVRLILRIKLPRLITLLKLLLLERSVLVIGDSPEEVTSCSFALVELLKPFEWSSVFIPSLSEHMLDFISSPVPFISGVTRNQESQHLIEATGRREMVNVVNLTENKIIWSEEEAVQHRLLAHCRSIRNCWFSSDELDNYQQRIEFLATKNNSSFTSFETFFRGPSRKEAIVIKSIKSAIESYLKSLGGFLTKYSHGWRAFGKKDEIMKDMVFTDKKFTRIMNHQFEFRKEFSRTQLLSCYYDGRKKEYESICEYRCTRAGMLIAAWVYFRFKKMKKPKNIVATSA